MLAQVRQQGGGALTDEPETVPLEATYENSTYFDEIYHARTAYEHILGLEPYENTHPTLGKLLISLGIRAFGMNPFGWRFMGGPVRGADAARPVPPAVAALRPHQAVPFGDRPLCL